MRGIVVAITGHPVLKLFVREGCHLCEEAVALLGSLGMAVDEVDIADDLDLDLRYGLRIPVLQATDGGRELDWPFDAQMLSAWLTPGAQA